MTRDLFYEKHLGEVDTLLNHLLVFVNRLLMSRQLTLGIISLLQRK